jgi:hypothetical protein
MVTTPFKHQEKLGAHKAVDDDFDGHQRNLEVLDILWHELQEQRHIGLSNKSLTANSKRRFFRRSQRVLREPSPGDVGTDDSASEHNEMRTDDVSNPSHKSTWRLRRALRLPSLSDRVGGETCQNDSCSSSSTTRAAGVCHPDQDHGAFSCSDDDESGPADQRQCYPIDDGCSIPTNANGTATRIGTLPSSSSEMKEKVGDKKRGRFSTMFPWRASSASEVV